MHSLNIENQVSTKRYMRSPFHYVDQLIQAMASFGVPQGVDGKWMEEQKDALQPILATYWKAV